MKTSMLSNTAVCSPLPRRAVGRGRWLAAAALWCAVQGAMAQVPAGITGGEMALLPEYCADVQATGRYTDPMGGNPSPRSAGWVQAMGDTFWSMHHHCWALIRMHRSRQPGITPQAREGHIRGAIGDYIYVLNNERANFPLKPEVYARLGEAYAALPAPGEALEAYQKSRQTKADYWPAYTWAADTLMVLGRRKEAVELLEQGLVIMPGSPEITRKLEVVRRGAGAKAGTANKAPNRNATAKQPAVTASSPAASTK